MQEIRLSMFLNPYTETIPFQQFFVQLLIHGHQVLLRSPQNPVGHSLTAKPNALAVQFLLLPAQRRTHDKLLGHDMGVFHCFYGSAELARQLVNLGWYVGFTGVLTFKNARRAIEAAAAVPLERIVLETDSPYMSPEPYRGRRNDPSRLCYMAEKLAQIQGLPIEEIQRNTTENGKRLYGIG